MMHDDEPDTCNLQAEAQQRLVKRMGDDGTIQEGHHAEESDAQLTPSARNGSGGGWGWPA